MQHVLILFAPLYSAIAAQQVAAVAQQAEDKKMQKCKHLDSCHFFTLVALETTGVFGPRTTEFLKQLGHRLRQVSGSGGVCTGNKVFLVNVITYYS